MFPEIFAEVDIPEVNGLAEFLDDELKMALERASGRTEAVAKQLAPVDTGALRNSIYTWIFGGSNTYFSASRAAQMKAADRGKWLRLAGMPRPPDDVFESVVSVAAEYAIYVEYGHMSKRATNVAGKRRGKITETIASGETEYYDAGVYTFTPGTLFMTGAAEDAQYRILPKEVDFAINRAKERGK